MKKLWIVAMACITTSISAQQNQNQVTQDKSSKGTTSTTTTDAEDEVALEGRSFKITLMARAGGLQGTMLNEQEKNPQQDLATRPGTTLNQPGAQNQNTGVTSQPGTTSGTETQSQPGNQNNPETSNQDILPGSRNNPQEQQRIMNPNTGSYSEFMDMSGKTIILAFKKGKIKFLSTEDMKSASTNESDVYGTKAESERKDTKHSNKSCDYRKTSGSGTLVTFEATCVCNEQPSTASTTESSDATTTTSTVTTSTADRAYWNGMVDGNKISGNVTFTSAGKSQIYTFTGTRTYTKSKKPESKTSSSL